MASFPFSISLSPVNASKNASNKDAEFRQNNVKKSIFCRLTKITASIMIVSPLPVEIGTYK